jgi:hypothetical protein
LGIVERSVRLLRHGKRRKCVSGQKPKPKPKK